MPSNSTVTHPSPSPRPVPSRGSLRATLLAGLLTFALVLGIFIAYAYLAPATYRTSALVTVETVGGARAALPPPREAAQRLKRALVRPEILTAISNGVLPTASPAQTTELHDHLRTRTEIETADSSTYRVSCLLPAARLAEHACNAMATKLVGLAPDVLDPGPSPEDEAKDKARQRRTDELVAFLAAHPELSAQPSPAPDVPSGLPTEAKDRTLMLLRQERAQIEARLAASRLPPTTDNPYDDPNALLAETTLLKRRLAEINGSLQSRRTALAAPATPRAQKPAPALVAEWQRLLGAVAEVGASSVPTSASSRPRLQARVASAAPYPGTPIEPNRQLLLLVGLLVALGTGILAAVTQNALESRPGTRRSLPRSSPTVRRAPPEASELPSSGPMLAAAGLDPKATHSSLELEDTERAPRSQPPSEPARNSSDPASADWALKLSNELSDPPGESASNLAQLALKPARTPSQRRLELVEVNAPIDEPNEAEPKPAAEKAVVPGRFSAGRSTQMLGSPITPVLPGRAVPTAPPPAATLSRATPSGGYSYVSSPPAGERLSSAPSSSPPQAAPPLPSSSDPVASPSESSSAPPPPATPIPRTVVTTHRVPAGWQPEPSLLPDTHRSLCDELYPLAVQQCFVIAISGVPGSSEETSRVASELALGLADTGHPRILLVEANFQRPAVQRWMHLEVPLFCGFSEQLQTRALEGSSGPWNVVECSPALHVLAEGVMRAPELIRSPQFAQAIRDLREHYDFIVVNAPLTSEKAACRAVQDLVDGVIVVYPKTSSPPLAEASGLFAEKRYSTVLAAR